jgi:hypothetical protein
VAGYLSRVARAGRRPWTAPLSLGLGGISASGLAEPEHVDQAVVRVPPADSAQPARNLTPEPERNLRPPPAEPAKPAALVQASPRPGRAAAEAGHRPDQEQPPGQPRSVRHSDRSVPWVDAGMNWPGSARGGRLQRLVSSWREGPTAGAVPEPGRQPTARPADVVPREGSDGTGQAAERATENVAGRVELRPAEGFHADLPAARAPDAVPPAGLRLTRDPGEQPPVPTPQRRELQAAASAPADSMVVAPTVSRAATTELSESRQLEAMARQPPVPERDPAPAPSPRPPGDFHPPTVRIPSPEYELEPRASTDGRQASSRPPLLVAPSPGASVTIGQLDLQVINQPQTRRREGPTRATGGPARLPPELARFRLLP